MNMVVRKLIFLNLVMTVFATECDYVQLEQGAFNMKWNKTEAFMYAFYNLHVPDNTRYHNFVKAFMYIYQQELWNKFYESHKNHIQFMFAHPCTWYLGNAPKNSNEYKICKETMNNNYVSNLTDSKEKALEVMFLKLTKQKDYMDYVGPLIKKYVKYSSARSPSEFCNNIESPAVPLPVDENGYVDISQIVDEVEEETQFQADPNPQIASSSVVNKPVWDFDLNQLPPNED